MKIRLAQELVERFHGAQAAKAAKADFEAQFSKGEVPDDIPEFVLSLDEITVYLPRVLREAGLVESTSEAKRLIKQSAVSINGKKVQSEEIEAQGPQVVLKIGKRRFLRIIRR